MRLMKRYVLTFLFLCLLLIPTGCQSNLQEDYVLSDEATYSVVAPAIEKWLTTEPGLVCQDGAEVQDWQRKLRSWQFKIEQAKKALEAQKESE